MLMTSTVIGLTLTIAVMFELFALTAGSGGIWRNAINAKIEYFDKLKKERELEEEKEKEEEARRAA